MYGYLIVVAVSSTIHVVFPTRVQRVEELNPSSFSTLLLSWYLRLCRPYDNFPSTQVAFSVLVVGASHLKWGPGVGGVSLLWAILVAVSTLRTKQHCLADVVVGGVLGSAVFYLVMQLIQGRGCSPWCSRQFQKTECIDQWEEKLTKSWAILI